MPNGGLYHREDGGPAKWEIEGGEAHRLLLFVQEQLRKKLGIPSIIDADYGYLSPKRRTMLCNQLYNILKSLDKKTFERLVYNAHVHTSRDLADWWERHLKGFKP